MYPVLALTKIAPVKYSKGSTRLVNMIAPYAVKRIKKPTAQQIPIAGPPSTPSMADIDIVVNHACFLVKNISISCSLTVKLL
jgi:hypothetical protein